MRIGKLKALNVAREKRPGMYNDGGGLYLQVTGAGAKSWVFRYWISERDPTTGEFVREPTTNKVRGTSREMGLGSCIVVTLNEARERAAECRRLREKGIDPIEARREAKQKGALEKAKALKFRDAAAAYITAHRAGWRNDKHVRQWENTLAAYADPIIGALSVQAVDTSLICKVLESIWTTKPETASRVRGRIESILDWAKVRGYRQGENPARWRGHLDHLLPARSKVRKVEHHPALRYAEMPAFMAELHKRNGITARALEFAIVTAARTGEVLAVRWQELDLDGAVWIVPANRMKARREHRVPLSARALTIVKKMMGLSSEFVFPGAGGAGKPLSEKALWETLYRMKIKNATVHGFRSAFRDWCAERTNYPNEVAEMALAHTVGDKVEAAYRRGDLFEKRRRLMDEWAKFCTSPPKAGAAIVPLRSAGAL
jgi:integrase